MTNYTFKIYYEDDSTTFKRNGGWKLVRGHTPEQAVRKFRAKFPDLYPLMVDAGKNTFVVYRDDDGSFNVF